MKNKIKYYLTIIKTGFAHLYFAYYFGDSYSYSKDYSDDFDSS